MSHVPHTTRAPTAGLPGGRPRDARADLVDIVLHGLVFVQAVELEDLGMRLARLFAGKLLDGGRQPACADGFRRVGDHVVAHGHHARAEALTPIVGP